LTLLTQLIVPSIPGAISEVVKSNPMYIRCVMRDVMYTYVCMHGTVARYNHYMYLATILLLWFACRKSK
jgi:hypothetical protein